MDTDARSDLAKQFRLVAVGGALGTIVRYGMSSILSGVGTVLALNVIGSLFLGWLAARHRNSSLWRMVGVGFCGGLTTFSTFALDVATWLDRGDVADGVGLLTVTVFGALGAVVTGFALGTRSVGRRL